jgi:hypothetical protein
MNICANRRKLTCSKKHRVWIRMDLQQLQPFFVKLEANRALETGSQLAHIAD